LLLVNGSKIRYSQFAGRFYPKDRLGPELARKYPNSVYFDKDGFPDFSPYAKSGGRGEGGKHIYRFEAGELGKSRSSDKRLALMKSGLARTPKGWIWEHGRYNTMMLVPKDLHGKVGHHGGWSISQLGGWPAARGRRGRFRR